MKKKKKLEVKKYTLPKAILKKIRKVPRSKLITQKMVGKVFRVHNGKEFLIVVVTNLKLGTKMGEYIFTKKACIHKKKKKKKKK